MSTEGIGAAALSFGDLPPAMQREVAEALERMRAAQFAQQQAPQQRKPSSLHDDPSAPEEEGTYGDLPEHVTRSALERELRIVMRDPAHVALISRMRRLAEAIAEMPEYDDLVQAASVAAAAATRDGGEEQPSAVRRRRGARPPPTVVHDCVRVRVLDAMRCVRFSNLAVVVAESDCVATLGCPASPDTHNATTTPPPQPAAGNGKPEIGAAGARKKEEEARAPVPLLRLEMTWRSLHFAVTTVPAEPQQQHNQQQQQPAVADGSAPVAVSVHAAGGVFGPLTLQSQHLERCRVVAEPSLENTKHRDLLFSLAQRLLVPPASGVIPSAPFAAHLEIYTRGLTHLALAELLMRFNGRTRIARVARKLVASGRLPRGAAAAGAVARGTSVAAAADDDQVETSRALTLGIPGGAYVVLGMGAGTIAAFLGASFQGLQPRSSADSTSAPLARVCTVELEPSVVAANRLHFGFPIAPPSPAVAVSCVVGEALQVLQEDSLWEHATGIAVTSDEPGATAIFLDCYDPVADNMLVARQLLLGCKSRLRPGGVLAVNAHLNAHADLDVLRPFVDVFGAANVHAGLVNGYCQALVVCSTPFPQHEDSSSSSGAPSTNSASAATAAAAAERETTLSGLWDYVTVARLASHPDVRVALVPGSSKLKGSGVFTDDDLEQALPIARNSSSAPPMASPADVPPSCFEIGLSRDGWLDASAVTGSAKRTLPKRSKHSTAATAEAATSSPPNPKQQPEAAAAAVVRVWDVRP